MKQLLFTGAFLTSSCPHVSCGKDCKSILMKGLIHPRCLPPHEMFDPLLAQKIANYFIGWHFHTSRYYRKVRRCLHWGNWIFFNCIFALRNDWFIKIVTALLNCIASVCEDLKSYIKAIPRQLRLSRWMLLCFSQWKLDNVLWVIRSNSDISSRKRCFWFQNRRRHKWNSSPLHCVGEDSEWKHFKLKLRRIQGFFNLKSSWQQRLNKSL